MSFKEYLSFYRVKKSLDMLKNGSPVLQTALACGFGNTSSFVRSFRRYMGITPVRFKKEDIL